MHNNIILTLCVLCGFSLNGQVNLDSLYTVWQDQTQLDSIRARAYTDYIWDGYLFSQPDSAFVLAEKLVAFGLDKHYLRAQYAGYTLQGVSWVNRSDYQKTLDYYNRALTIAEKMGERHALGIVNNNLGSLYHTMADYAKALDHYVKSLEFSETRQMSTTLDNIGRIYKKQGNYQKALEYYNRSLRINQLKGDQGGEANVLSNIGEIYRDQLDYRDALDYFTQSLKIYEQLNHQVGIANTYNIMGTLYYMQGESSTALDYYQKGLQIFEQIGNKNGISATLNNIGEIYQKQGEYDKALDYCQKGYEISLTIQSLFRKKSTCICLYETYKAMGNDNKALHYFELLKAVEDSLKTKEPIEKLQHMEFQAEARLIQEAHEEAIRQKEKTRNISLAAGAFFLLLAGSFYTRWRYVHKSKASIQIEKDRSEHLLLNILPKDVAQELKESGKAAPKKYESVTILFTDFKDFTKLAASISANQLVVELNDIFGQFDDIMDEFGIEKIETIGDAYLAVSGLPRENSDHALRCVNAAFRMLEVLDQRNVTSEINWNMRIGIHTGPVIAGVVGKKKFSFDIFGDSVNTASRIESNGEVGKVNISQATYELLKNEPNLVFESRGRIEAKGKGEIEMYFVTKK
ncbi:MAG TPA: adenylate/guanylate cyclase domain-containing protein [Flavobacteriaceae bacterium]